MSNIFPSFIVIENFYEQPDKVREYALQQEYEYKQKYYPGKRSINSYYSASIHDTMKTILSPYFSDIRVNEGSSNGEFQITNKYDKSWIHQDEIIKNYRASISGVCYLTPNAPLESGTAFYEKDFDNNNYIQSDIVTNKYNRLILFNGQLHHMSGKYFGTMDTDSRLTQVFFLDCS